MEGSFDPYRKWLGIPPQDQPPHHYRLLGIEPFEPDPDVIVNAADGRMAQIKNFQAGKYTEQSQRLLNEIAAAKVCLLNPEKRNEYDQQLRQRLEAEKKPAPKAAPPIARQAKPKPESKTSTSAEPGVPSFESSSVFSYISSRGRKQRSWQIPVVTGVVAVLLVGLLIFLVSRGDGTTVAEQPQPQSEEQPKKPSPNSRPPAAPENPEPEDPPAKPQEDKVVQPAPDTIPPESDPEYRWLADLVDPGDNGSNDPVFEQPNPNQPPDGPIRPKRLPVPDEEAQREEDKRIREIFKKDFDDAKKPEDKLALAEKLANQAEETADNPVARFVLMQLACEMLAEAGDLTKTLEMADRIQQRYDVDALELKARLLDRVIEAMPTGPKASVVGQQAAEAAWQLADQAVAGDDFVTASRFAKLASDAARKTRNGQLIGRAEIRSRELNRLKTRFSTVLKALDVLAENPADGEANLTAGRWYCFSVGNWSKGLPLLAKGTQAEPARLAVRDMAGPKDFKEQKKLGDDWWKLAEGEKGPEQRGIRDRAAYWYQGALPELSGLERAEVEKRLEAVKSSSDGAGPKIPRVRGAVQPGNVATVRNGARIVGPRGPNPARVIDGDPNKRTGSYEKWPTAWTILLDKVYRLQEIRIRLWDGDKRFYRYAVSVSSNGKDYELVADRREGEWSSWQIIRFSPRPVGAIKLIGTFGSANRDFHVIAFEAYSVPPAPLPPLKR